MRLSLFLLLGVLSLAAQIKVSGSSLNVPAQPIQLQAGAKPGTFHYFEAVCAKFSLHPAYPIDYVVDDYAGKEVYHRLIQNDRPLVVSFDLPPGSYQVRYRAVGAARKIYEDMDGAAFFIFRNGIHALVNENGDGQMQYWNRPHSDEDNDFTFVATLRHKIEIIEPVDRAEVKGDLISLRWKPVPGIWTYTTMVFPIEDLEHPDSAWVADRQSEVVKGGGAKLPVGYRDSGWYVKPGKYSWIVVDGDWENDTEGKAGHTAHGEGTFAVPGGEQDEAPEGIHSFPGDKVPVRRLGLQLLQPRPHSSDPEQPSLVILAVGGDGPAMRAGLMPGQRIAEINGKPVWRLDELEKAVAAIPSGSKVTLGISYNNDPLKVMTWPCDLTVR